MISKEKIRFIETLTWDEVLTVWETSEASLPRWVEHIKKRGFSTWKEWRMNSISILEPQNLQWSMYEIDEPSTTIPTLKGGPFRTWIKQYYGDVKRPTFAEIAQHPNATSSKMVQEIIDAFPKETYLIGLKSEGDIVIIDGMHRCTALAVAAQQGRTIDTKVMLMMADFPHGDIPLMGQETSPAV